jgi:hypothetical protein
LATSEESTAGGVPSIGAAAAVGCLEQPTDTEPPSRSATADEPTAGGVPPIGTAAATCCPEQPTDTKLLSRSATSDESTAGSVPSIGATETAIGCLEQPTDTEPPSRSATADEPTAGGVPLIGTAAATCCLERPTDTELLSRSATSDESTAGNVPPIGTAAATCCPEQPTDTKLLSRLATSDESTAGAVPSIGAAVGCLEQPTDTEPPSRSATTDEPTAGGVPPIGTAAATCCPEQPTDTELLSRSGTSDESTAGGVPSIGATETAIGCLEQPTDTEQTQRPAAADVLANSAVILQDVNSPFKAKRGIPAWFHGKVSPAFAQHISWPSPPKRKKQIPHELYPAAASTATWRELYRQKKTKQASGKAGKQKVSDTTEAAIRISPTSSAARDEELTQKLGVSSSVKRAPVPPNKRPKAKRHKVGDSVDDDKLAKQVDQSSAAKYSSMKSVINKVAATGPKSKKEPDDPECYVCCGLFSKSKRGEKKWIQCDQCKKWAHEVCIDIRPTSGEKFICDFCS